MERTNKDTPGRFSMKVESKEWDRTAQARKNLDDIKGLAIYAAQYLDLGWSPVVLEAYNGADLRVDFGQPQAAWLWVLMDLALQDPKIGLAIRFEVHSRLFVLRVKPALGRSLDRLGNWRSPCVARIGDLWEHHFLVLPPTWCFSSEHITGDREAPLSVIGPGQLVMVPPSLDHISKETWHWLSPPWEQPPCNPSFELLILLEGCGFIARRSLTVEEDLPPWKEIYPFICHSEKLLQALLAPEESSEHYYWKILHEAVAAGFRDLRLLQSLLWHAPHGDLRLNLEGWQQLSSWTERIERLLSAETSSFTACAPGEIESATATSFPEDLMNELHFLAAQTQELEQQLEKMEDLHFSPESAAGGSLSPQESLGELAQLRQAVEEFLAEIKDLSETE